jgi:hypothetical protein
MSCPEPTREVLTDLSGADKGQPASTDGFANVNVPKANIRKSPDIGDYFKVDPESRIEEAHVNVGLVQDEPVMPFQRLPKLEVDDDTVIRQIFCPYQPVQDPHEEVWIKVLVAEITT